MVTTLPRVCYLGAYAADYPRNLILRRGLAHHGVEVVECRVSTRLNTRQRAAALAPQFREIADRCDVIILAEFNQTLAWFAGILAWRYRKRLIIDAFTSLYDSAVHDRAEVAPVSLPALRYWLADYLALHLPQSRQIHRILTDTDQHRCYFERAFRANRDNIAVIPVGASQEWFDTPHFSRNDDCTLISFYGSYIPLHGVETILHAAQRLQDHKSLRFELIGRGQTYPAMRALAQSLGVTNVQFLDRVPSDELPALVARADICLGIFGTTAKAQRVAPNKAFQTLALGKPLISADTPGLREFFTPNEHLLTAPPGEPELLAETILKLVSSHALREQLGKAGRARMEAAYTETAVGRMLLDAIG